jgi:uncharacterized protein YbjT (DUF2867 family)
MACHSKVLTYSFWLSLSYSTPVRTEEPAILVPAAENRNIGKILVTGATGRVGREVVSQLAARGVPFRALVRNPQTAALTAHSEIFQGDLTVADSLDRCLEGIETVFLVWTAPAGAAGPALDRIARLGRRIVFLSAPHKTPHPFFQAGQPNPLSLMHAEIERRIEDSGCPFTFLRPGLFAANTRDWWAPQIRAGLDVVRWPYASAATAPIHERDIAAVAVCALCDEGHAGQEYVLTGPEAITQAAQIEAIGEAIGRPLRMEEITPDEARRELLSLFPALPVVNMLLGAWSGAIGHPALITNTVAEITGARARTFQEWVAGNAAAFKS